MLLLYPVISTMKKNFFLCRPSKLHISQFLENSNHFLFHFILNSNEQVKNQLNISKKRWGWKEIYHPLVIDLSAPFCPLRGPCISHLSSLQGLISFGRLEPNDKSFGNYLFDECKSTLAKKRRKKDGRTRGMQFIRHRYRRRIYTHHADLTRVDDKRPMGSIRAERNTWQY